jgi:hypothetical protein
VVALVELLVGADVVLETAEVVGDVVAAEELALNVDDVVDAATAAPKFHPLIWTATTDEPLGPAAVLVRNQSPGDCEIVRKLYDCPGVKGDAHWPTVP